MCHLTFIQLGTFAFEYLKTYFGDIYLAMHKSSSYLGCLSSLQNCYYFSYGWLQNCRNYRSLHHTRSIIISHQLPSAAAEWFKTADNFKWCHFKDTLHSVQKNTSNKTNCFKRKVQTCSKVERPSVASSAGQYQGWQVSAMSGLKQPGRNRFPCVYEV